MGVAPILVMLLELCKYIFFHVPEILLTEFG